MEDQFGFHGKPPTPEQAEQALTELEATLAEQDAELGADRDDAACSTRTRSPTRKAYGDALVELGEQHDEVVALDADLAVSTQSIKFGKQVPGALLQRRHRRGEHDVDGLRPRDHRQGARTPRPSRSSPPAAPTTRCGSGSPTTS